MVDILTILIMTDEGLLTLLAIAFAVGFPCFLWGEQNERNKS
ncbi:hypothetical protein U8C35_06370 [Sinorhizobium medicae]|nr:hypothetical protein [Sinorhizobium medicae]WQO60057.1 hypothetical protein U8C35_06370 [Sinorhizobium medicae]